MTCPVIDPPRPPPEADGGSVDRRSEEQREQQRAMRQLAQCRKSTWRKRLGGYTAEGHRVGDTRRDCRIPDSVVQRVRALHEDSHWTCRRILATLKQELRLSVSLSWVRKVCGYERRRSVAVTWKPIEDGE